MGLKIVYSKISLENLKEIYNYIKRNSPYYAKHKTQLIRLAVKKLKVNPLLGRTFEKSENELTRELIYRNYRIIYDLMIDNEINILSIHHHARLISNNPAFKEDE